MTMPNSETKKTELLDSLLTKPSRISDNTAQEVIIVTRDRVELALHRNLPKYVPSGKALSSAGLFVALLAAVLTADFQQRLGISGDTWNGAFWLATAAAFVLMLRDAFRWVRRPALSELVDAIESDVDASK